MKTGGKLLLVALGAAGGYVAAKYGKQIVSVVKENSDKEHLEAIANDLKEHSKKVADSMKKSAESIKKSVDELRYEAEKAMFADLADFEDIEDYFMCKSEEDYQKEPVSVPVVETEDVSPVEVKVAENPEEVRKVVEETLAEAEELIKEETKIDEVKSAAEVLKKRRTQNVNKTRAKKTVKVEDAEPAKAEDKVETVETDKAE